MSGHIFRYLVYASLSSYFADAEMCLDVIQESGYMPRHLLQLVDIWTPSRCLNTRLHMYPDTQQMSAYMQTPVWTPILSSDMPKHTDISRHLLKHLDICLNVSTARHASTPVALADTYLDPCTAVHTQIPVWTLFQTSPAIKTPLWI